MIFESTVIPDVKLIKPKVFEDSRGYFMETYQKEIFIDAGIPDEFVQDSHSRSRQGVLRGLHYQIRQTQGKLVRVVRGEIFDVAVDLRESSPTFGQWVGIVISAENKYQLWVPKGFAHGFYTMSSKVDMIYKVTDYYAPEWERTLIWNDPYIGIEWPLINNQTPILSDKDARGELFTEADIFQEK